MNEAPFKPYQKYLAEFIGTMFLLAMIVGSGIMGDNLAGGNDAIALIVNCISVGAGLIVLITIFGPVSGAHFNPAVTLAMLQQKALTLPQGVAYIAKQIIGGICGVLLVHVMFDMEAFQVSYNTRSGLGQWVAEGVATFGLLSVIFAGLRFGADKIPMLVGLYITSAYFFTASTSFANPAVTIARSLTDTFTGIRAEDVPYFVLAQVAAVPLALVFKAFVFYPAPDISIRKSMRKGLSEPK